MSAPRHLWSGDWRLDSAAAGEEMARRRAQAQEPAEDLSRSGERMPDVQHGARDRLSALRPSKTSLLVVLSMLLVAAAAYGAASLVAGSARTISGNANRSRAYLGVDTAGTPFSFPGSASGFPFVSGVMLTNVAPGSPAAAAGLQAGDVITSIANQTVRTPVQLDSAIARMHPGDRVDIQYVQSLTTYSTQATLTSPPGPP